MRIYSLAILLALFLLLIIACNDEEKSSVPYIGVWETETVCIQMNEQGSMVNRKMVCDFSTDSFSNVVNLVIGHIEEPLCGIKGLIHRTEGTGLHLICTQLGVYTGLNIDWIDADSTGFDSLYTGYVDVFMPVEFEANYLMEGKNLDLILNSENDTIHLTRK